MDQGHLARAFILLGMAFFSLLPVMAVEVENASLPTPSENYANNCKVILGKTLEAHVFNTTRTLELVAEASPERLKALRNLKAGDAILDYGSGEGKFLNEMASPLFSEVRKKLGIQVIPNLVGITYKRERGPSDLEEAGKVHILLGKKSKEWKDEDFTKWGGKFKVVIDENGVLSYTDDLSGEMNRIARITKPNAIVSLTGKLDATTTSILTKEGHVLSLSQYIASQPGVRVLDAGSRHIDFQFTGEPKAIFPDTKLVYGNEAIPPERLFMEMDPSAWDATTRVVAIKALRESAFVRGQLNSWTKLSRLVFTNTLYGPYGEFEKFKKGGDLALSRFEKMGISRNELLKPQNVYGLYLALVHSGKVAEAQEVLTKYAAVIQADISPLGTFILTLNSFVLHRPNSALLQLLSTKIKLPESQSPDKNLAFSDKVLAAALLDREPLAHLVNKGDNSDLIEIVLGLWSVWNSDPEAKKWLSEVANSP